MHKTILFSNILTSKGVQILLGNKYCVARYSSINVRSGQSGGRVLMQNPCIAANICEGGRMGRMKPEALTVGAK